MWKTWLDLLRRAPADEGGGAPTDGAEGADTTTPADASVLSGAEAASEGGGGATTAEDAKTGNGDGEAGGDQKPEGDDRADSAPEYGDFTLPDGMEMDAETLGEFTPIARDLGLTQDQAQRLIDIQTGFMQRLAEREATTAQQQRDAWIGEIKADPDIGGPKFDASVKAGNTAVSAIWDKPTINYLISVGALSHPGVVRGLVKASRAFAPDGFTGPSQGGGAPSEERALRNLYPTMTSKR